MTAVLWTWLVGYLVVRFKGPHVEKMLSAAARNGITLWGIQRLTTDIVVARLTVRQFRQLRPILRDYGVSAAVFERQGFPFIFAQLKRRLFFIIGLVVVSAVIIYLSSFVWFIEVTGSEGIPTDHILDVAVAHGLYSGLPKRAVNAPVLEAALLTRFPELAWVNVRVEGTRAVIEVVERQEDEYDPNIIGDIVAAFGGVVTDVFVARGTALVRPGDIVEPGDILISGTYYDFRGRRQEGRAQGKVLARIWREAFAEAALFEDYQLETGKTSTQWRLKLGRIIIPLGPGSRFDAYRTDERAWQLKVGTIGLPIQFMRRTFHEIEYERRYLPQRLVEERAQEAAWAILEQQGVDRSKVEEVHISTIPVPDAEAVRVNVAVRLEQNIGEFQEQ